MTSKKNVLTKVLSDMTSLLFQKSSLRNLCVLCASAVYMIVNRSDAENAVVAKRIRVQPAVAGCTRRKVFMV
jgi:hypothetical protein